jgi:RHH-type transcriptional regulator, rel operon repressor / antitoxin RelB
MLSICLPKEIDARLDKLAKRTGRSKNFYAREAILQHLDDLEDLYLAKHIVQRIESGEERTSMLEEVEVALGMAVRRV